MLQQSLSLLFVSSVILLSSCVNKEADINDLFPEQQDDSEYAYNGYLLYSDSAEIKVRLEYDVLRKFRKDGQPMSEFPEGIYVEFYDQYQNPTSWLVANYALRNDRVGNMVARDSVVLYNSDQDKLETSELEWNEKESLIETEKFVRISQPMKGDTSYGYGFRAKQDFSEFEIGKFSGKGTIPGFK